MSQHKATILANLATVLSISATLVACGSGGSTDGTAAATGTTASTTTVPVIASTADASGAALLGTTAPDAVVTATATDASATPATIAAAVTTVTASATVATTAKAPRVMENLGRGVVALRVSSANVFVSWRLLGLDPAAIAFNLYRSAAGATPFKLNATALTAGTNYMDTTSDKTVANTYTVRPVIDGVEQAASGPFTLTANHAGEPVVRIPLQPLPAPDYTSTYVWVGDLDGDGEYDYVIDRVAPGVDDVGTGNQFLEAYKRDGTRLWQIDLGPGSRNLYHISPGPTTLDRGMYDGVTVYDLNGDGKAEVILKVADGVKFGDGTTFTNTDPNQQFVAVIDGLTGKPLATHAFPTTYAAAGPCGTQFGIGYANGITPSIYFWGRNRNADKSFNDVFASWSWNGGTTITDDWVLPMGNAAPKEASHQLRIQDLDGDGKDELMTGNMAINSNGTVRYILPVKHGDRFYVGKMDPNSTDMQGYGIQQNNASGLLEYYYNATTGAMIWTHSTTPGTLVDVGRGLAGDVDARFPGHEAYSFSGLYNGPTGTLTQPSVATYPYPQQEIWWDGDLLIDQLGDNVVDRWDAPTGKAQRLETLYNYNSAWVDHDPMFIGDIMGDWRTEVVTTNKTYTELMIFSTDIPTTTRVYTMAHNPAYRNHMTIKGYMQSPTLDYYFGADMKTPPVPNIRYAGTGTIQAESALLGGGTTVATDRSGYHGNGFIDFPGTGGTAQFTVDGGLGGAKTVVVRFANGDGTARTGTLTVNGKAQNVTFAATGGWTNWTTVNVPVTLAKGMANKLVFASNGGDLGNIDEITVQ